MTKVLQRVEVSLRSFYIFNSSFGRKENEEYKKVLYYYPNDIELNTKIKDVGLSEAIIAFTGTFTAEDDCQAVHTQKTTQIFYQPEKDYWMVLVINVPKEIRSKDGVEVAEYKGMEVNDRIFHAVLEQCYNMFRLFVGTFNMNLEANGGGNNDEARKQLQQTLTLFFDKHLQTLKLSACDAMDVMRSIQYLPLDKGLFLRAHNFINMIRATFPIITETVLFHNDQVVCSGSLDPIDLNCVHEYIVNTVLSRTSQCESGASALMRSNSNSSESYRNGVFFTGPETAELSQQPPRVYLKKDTSDTLQVYFLIVYRVLGATLCLFVHDQMEPNNDFYSELESYMSSQLSSIARDIGETITKQQQTNGKQSSSSTPSLVTSATTNATTMTPKYLFINEQSLKHLSNISVDKRRPKATHNVPMNVMNLIADMENDVNMKNADLSPSFEEVQVKTTNDYWIVKRRCNWRQYYVIILNKNATLLEITVEAKRVFEQELTDDVFFDK